MNRSSRARIPGRLFLACAVAAPLVIASAHAQTLSEPITLDDVVVSASRTPQDLQFTASSVTLLDVDSLRDSQITDLKTALASQPGVNVKSTGALGGTATAYFRGLNDNQNLFVVDGIRMNTRATGSGFLNSADLSGNDRIEILRGPQSALYGSSALGGVTRIDTAQGCGAPTGAVSATAGSFDTYGASGNVQGGSKVLSYSASVSGLTTENERERNAFESRAFTSRLEYTPTSLISAGATVRLQNADYEEPGSVAFPFPGDSESDSLLATLYADWRPVEVFRSRLTGGYHQRNYTWTSVGGSPDEQTNRRHVVDWQNTWQAHERLEVTGGLTHERAEHDINGDVNKADPATAEFLNILGRPFESLALTLGGRHEDLGDAGEANTWKTGAAWQAARWTKLRATYGTGFSAPSESEILGVPAWFLPPSPDLRPEKSRGWDAGIDQEILPGAMSASVTYFQNRVKDMIDFDFGTFSYRNIAQAETSGVEIELNNTYGPVFSSRVAYTYLDTEDANGQRLIYRPRHVADVELRARVTADWLLGAGCHVVADRMRSTTASIEDYTTVRLFASYRANKNLTLRARVENALDENYADTFGYEALSAAIYGSVEWRF